MEAVSYTHLDVYKRQDKDSLIKARDAVMEAFGRIDILINGAGGNKKDATVSPNLSFFDIPADALEWVFKMCIRDSSIPMLSTRLLRFLQTSPRVLHATLRSVSYTHLDVYKRQFKPFPIRKTKTLLLAGRLSSVQINTPTSLKLPTRSLQKRLFPEKSPLLWV